MKACTNIFIEPNGVNAYIRRTPLPESPDLSWSRNSARLQTGEIRSKTMGRQLRNKVTKRFSKCISRLLLKHT